MVRRLGLLLLLVALLIPATVLPDSGDGDIPERRAGGYGGCSESEAPVVAPVDLLGESSIESGNGWSLDTLWVLFLETLGLLP